MPLAAPPVLPGIVTKQGRQRLAARDIPICHRIDSLAEARDVQYGEKALRIRIVTRSFAMLESRLVLATLARRFRPRLVPGRPVAADATFMLRSRHGLRMTIEVRQDARAGPTLA